MHATVRNATLLMLLLVLTACASLVYSEEDTRIQREVQLAISTAPDISSSSISVRVHDGVVTLEGEAQALIEKSAMVRVTLAVDGVRDVINLLYVRW